MATHFKYDAATDKRRERLPENAWCASCGLRLTVGEHPWVLGEEVFCSLNCAPLETFGLTEKDIRR